MENITVFRFNRIERKKRMGTSPMTLDCLERLNSEAKTALQCKYAKEKQTAFPGGCSKHEKDFGTCC